MKSLKNLFRYGPGPSSSHTIGPYVASSRFATFLKEGEPVKVTFYGSLAYSFRGHHSDGAVASGLEGHPVTFVMDKETVPPHPLMMRFEAESAQHVYFSLGGGAIYSASDPYVNEKEVYPFTTYREFAKAYHESGAASVPDFLRTFEDKDLDAYLTDLLKKMFHAVELGLSTSGRIPVNNNPRLQVSRSAKAIYARANETEKGHGRRELLLSAYGYAVVEGSACGDKVVTAPTCGSSGVLPAVLYYLYHDQGVPFAKLKDSLYIAGMIGNLVKENASIAGSVGGCQAEIGTATSMAAAALAYVDGLNLHQIEYGAEVAMEHFLGLSCDPVDGYVVIPCIERNGIGAIRAYDSFLYAKHIEPIRRNQVSFDEVVKAMKLTGDSLDTKYKETSLGGLAEILKETTAK